MNEKLIILYYCDETGEWVLPYFLFDKSTGKEWNHGQYFIRFDSEHEAMEYLLIYLDLLEKGYIKMEYDESLTEEIYDEHIFELVNN